MADSDTDAAPRHPRRRHPRAFRLSSILTAFATTLLLVLTLAEPAGATDPVTPGTATLSGTAAVGKTLTVSTSGWTPDTVAFGYQWWQSPSPYIAPVEGADQNPDAVAIDGATQASFALTPAQHGQYVWAVVTGTSEGLDPAQKIATTTGRVATGTLTTAPTPTTSGKIAVESPVTAVPGAWPEGTTFTYSWRITDAKGVERASKVTRATYTPTTSTAGMLLRVIVTGTAPGYAPVSKGTPKVTIAKGSFTAAPTPTITGNLYVGGTLTAVLGSWSPTATYAYAWKRNGLPISGATKSTYKLTALDGARTITVTVSATRAGYTKTTRTSAPTTPILKAFTKINAPTISGTAWVGRTLTASTVAWSPIATLRYQWKRDGVPIDGATARALAVTTEHVGGKLTVTVTGTRTGYRTRTATSAATPVVSAPTSITADGKYQVGVGIAPGTYSSPGGVDCWYERRSNDGDDLEGMLGWAYYWDYAFSGQKVITIAEDDAFFYTAECGTWTRVATSLKTSVKSGTYVVGSQVSRGTWQADGPYASVGCYIEFLQSFTGDPEVDVISGGYIEIDPPVRLVIPTTSYGKPVKGFTTYGCGTWKRVSG